MDLDMILKVLVHPLALLVLMTLIDTILGVAKAIKLHVLSSNIGKVGLLVNSGVILLVTVVYLVIAHFDPTAYGFPPVVATEIFGAHMTLSPQILANVFAYLFVWNQVISVIENLSELGVPMPAILVKVIKVVSNKVGDKEVIKFDENGNIVK
jgi:toxin secretion/phage lysis holin